MKFFVCCLLVIIHTITIANDSKQSLFVVDGDSVNVDLLVFFDLAKEPITLKGNKRNLKLRIAGIDTPEIKQTCEIVKDQSIDCGTLATQFLKELLENVNGNLVIEPVGVDYYQRILVRLYKGKVNIGKRMVEQGMAYSYDDTYFKEELIAREKKLGFWAFYSPPINPKVWRKTH
jgi:endonuclease YncB( thermonuclease family)